MSPRHREPMPDVVVLLPGIMGSVLKRDGKTLWGWSGELLTRTLFTRGAALHDDLVLGEDPPDVDDLEDGVTPTGLVPDLHLMPGLWKIDGYSQLAADLTDMFELWEGKNFHRFAYDWRRANQVSARRLASSANDWLRAWRAEYNPEAKLILIAHSMGGLVARYYLECLEGWPDVRALITFGTPFRGSLNSLDTLVNGVRKGPLVLGRITALARSFTSTYQLLPTYPCYDAGDGVLHRIGEIDGVPGVDSQRAADALRFHRQIEAAVEEHAKDPLYRSDGYRVYPIVGIHQQTLQSASAADGSVAMSHLREGADPGGDGTVPRPSATPYEYSNAGVEIFASAQHASLQNAASSLTQLRGILSGLSLDLGGFRGEIDVSVRPPRDRSGVALEVEDVFWDDEPVTVRARASHGAEQPMLATLVRGDGVLGEYALTPSGDGWSTATLPVLPADTYRVGVRGDESMAPVWDAFVVTPREDAPE